MGALLCLANQGSPTPGLDDQTLQALAGTPGGDLQDRPLLPLWPGGMIESATWRPPTLRLCQAQTWDLLAWDLIPTDGGPISLPFHHTPRPFVPHQEEEPSPPPRPHKVKPTPSRVTREHRPAGAALLHYAPLGRGIRPEGLSLAAMDSRRSTGGADRAGCHGRRRSSRASPKPRQLPTPLRTAHHGRSGEARSSRAEASGRSPGCPAPCLPVTVPRGTVRLVGAAR